MLTYVVASQKIAASGPQNTIIIMEAPETGPLMQRAVDGFRRRNATIGRRRKTEKLVLDNLARKGDKPKNPKSPQEVRKVQNTKSQNVSKNPKSRNIPTSTDKVTTSTNKPSKNKNPDKYT